MFLYCYFTTSLDILASFTWPPWQDSPSSQFLPEYHPPTHVHLYPPGVLVHLPPFLQGPLAHSSTSEKQNQRGHATVPDQSALVLRRDEENNTHKMKTCDDSGAKYSF